MIRGVVEHGFVHYDMNHLPLYYFLSALLLTGLGDAEVAGMAVSMGSGVLTVCLGAILALRLLGRRGFWLVGLVLCFQPELALYSASTLREPVYAACVLGALLACVQDRLLLASVLASLAFFTRMDALLVLGPVLGAHALGGQGKLKRLFLALGVLAGSVGLWSLYCRLHPEYQTFAFWGHSVAVNLSTGGASETASFSQWIADGFGVSLSLFGEVLPSRIGAGFWLALAFGLVRAPWRSHSVERTLSLATVLLLGFWLAIGFTAQHDPGHNLYWKWLHGVIPLLVIVGAAQLLRFADKLKAVLGSMGSAGLVGLVLLQAGLQFQHETARQLEQSASVNRPQLELAQWIESNTGDSAAMVLDNIPERWLSRRRHNRRFLSWMDIAECPSDENGCFVAPEDLGQLFLQDGITHVLWFKEEWTKGPVAAPYLADGTRQALGSAGQLVPVTSDRLGQIDGWVFYAFEQSQ